MKAKAMFLKYAISHQSNDLKYTFYLCFFMKTLSWYAGMQACVQVVNTHEPRCVWVLLRVYRKCTY